MSNKSNASAATKTVEQIKKLEQRAKDLQMKMWKIEEKWKKQMAKAKRTPEWTAHCLATGSVQNYNFSDILA